MGRTRKSYSPAFKAKVVVEMLKETRSIAELSSEYGVHATQLHRWRKEFLERLPEVFARTADWEVEKARFEERIEELYTEIGRMSTHLSWLKKNCNLQRICRALPTECP